MERRLKILPLPTFSVLSVEDKSYRLPVATLKKGQKMSFIGHYFS